MQRFICLIFLLVSPLVFAEPQSYNTLDIDYVDADVDPFEGDGWSLRGSGSIFEHIYVTGQYSDIGTDSSGNDLDVERLSLGAGYQMPLSFRNLNVYGQLSLENVETDSSVNRFDTDDSGFGLETGVRYAVAPKLEIMAAARYLDVGDYFNGEIGGSIGAVYDVLPWLGLSLDYENNNIDLNGDRGEDERILAGARVYWDKLNLPKLLNRD